MKKILLILLVLLCTGCYDYNELNDLEILSSLIVDYKDDKYEVNMEVLDTSESAEHGSYYLKGVGKTLEAAMNSVYYNSAKIPFYSHVKSLIISERVAERGIDDFFDYLLRDTRIRKDFYVFVSEDIEAVLDYKPKPKESLGEIAHMSAMRNHEDNGHYKTSTFRELIFNYLRDNNSMIGSLEIEDDTVTLENTYLFTDNKLDMKLDSKAALLMSMILSENDNFQIYGDYSYEIHGYKCEHKVTKDKITFYIDGEARLIDAKEKNDLNTRDLNELEKKLNEDIEKRIKDTLMYAKTLNKDLYNLNYYYYLYFPKSVEKDSWSNLHYEVKSNIHIGGKGLLLDGLGGKE